MSKVPSVSIVLPTYNRAHTLARSVESVLSQSFGEFELIVVDDGSNDGTQELLRTYAPDPRVRVSYRKHSGCAAARNHGLSLARGRYIAFQDSDDEWLPGKLEVAIATLDSADPTVALFYSPMIRVSEDGSEELYEAPKIIVPGRLIDEQTLDYQVWRIGIQSTVIRRDCLSSVGNFDERLSRYIDLDLLTRLALLYGYHHHDRPLVRYYKSPTTISRDQQAKMSARLHLLDKFSQQFEDNRLFIAAQHVIRLRPNHQFRLGMGYLVALGSVAVRAPTSNFVRSEIKHLNQAIRSTPRR